MTIERLEEIAAWASQESQVARRDGYTAVPQVLEDLARCARAWAGVERLKQQHGAVTLANGKTAFEAVEAAGGEK